MRPDLTMNSLIKNVAILVAAGMLASCSESVEGIWQGECRNDTVNSKSGLQMTIRQDGDKLQGILMLHDDLYGSGRLTGYLLEKDITICSEGDNQTFVNITWSGRVKGDTIKGVYRVEPTANATLLGRGVQTGTFIMQRK